MMKGITVKEGRYVQIIDHGPVSDSDWKKWFDAKLDDALRKGVKKRSGSVNTE